MIGRLARTKVRVLWLAGAVSLLILSMAQAGTKEEDSNDQLRAALKDATRLRVRTGGTCHRDLDEEKTLLDLRDADKVAQVIKGIQVGAEDGICMCCGEPTLEFYQDDRLILALGIHHGVALRCIGQPWQGDRPLTKQGGEFLRQWLAEHGVPGPKEGWEADQRRAKENAAAEKPKRRDKVDFDFDDPFAPVDD